jgi:CheY-like chemotaxis protein
LPVIVFSNTYLTNMVQEAWKAGATKCLSKANCTPKQVIEVVGGVLSTNGAHVGAPASPARPVEPVCDSAHRAAPAPEAPSLAKTGNADAQFQAELRHSFIEELPGTLAALRTSLQALVRAENDPVRLEQVKELYHRIHVLTGNAGVAGIPQIARMSDALEALLKELCDKPGSLTSSTLRSVALAIDFLGLLFERAPSLGNLENPPPSVLVVDDEAISRRAVTYSLDKAKLRSVCAEDAAAAYALLEENRYDLILLDVHMPGMSGFELCSRIRQLPMHEKTPVVFVTSLSDFDSRASSTMSGGNDLIAKPFLFIELAVKALVWILRGRLKAAK